MKKSLIWTYENDTCTSIWRRWMFDIIIETREKACTCVHHREKYKRVVMETIGSYFIENI